MPITFLFKIPLHFQHSCFASSAAAEHHHPRWWPLTMCRSILSMTECLYICTLYTARTVTCIYYVTAPFWPEHRKGSMDQEKQGEMNYLSPLRPGLSKPCVPSFLMSPFCLQFPYSSKNCHPTSSFVTQSCHSHSDRTCLPCHSKSSSKSNPYYWLRLNTDWISTRPHPIKLAFSLAPFLFTSPP